MQFRRPPRRGPAIDIAPLVDVVFLLVIFFAVSTTFLETAGLELELPESTSRAERESRELTVVLTAAGQVQVDERVVPAEDLAPVLREALAQRDDKGVVLRADAGTRHGDVVRVMDAIRDAGAAGLTVAAREPAER